MKKALVGSATRYIASRNAVQSVYWRTAGNPNVAGGSSKFIKVQRTCNFGNANGSGKMPSALQDKTSQTIRY